ncbi:MAG: D-tyrosyl-tRNA(Tyr) deacylase [Thermoleophilia bacterium]|nr:D-tyrosyl-tRNA(Tyr) deacylase [Thermoleophilia bacterium]
MRCVVQRVEQASVTVDRDVVGAISAGLLVLVAIAEGDGEAELAWMADKITRLRIFSDANGRFEHSLLETGGELLSVSQFTLYGDVRKGTRPSFSKAAPPAAAEHAWQRFNALVEARGVRVATGIFGAHMSVSLVNDGPVTIELERSPRE